LRRFRFASCQRSGPERWPLSGVAPAPHGPVPHEDCGEGAATLVDTCQGGTIRARSSQESVPTSHDDTARHVPARQGGTREPWTKSVAHVSQPAASLPSVNGRSVAGIRMGRTLDYVDRIVPPHYSAAPSGDLCTTSKQAFVVQGESRDSVPTTGQRPQPPQSSLARLFTIGQGGVPMWRQRRQAQSESTLRLMSGAATGSVVAVTTRVSSRPRMTPTRLIQSSTTSVGSTTCWRRTSLPATLLPAPLLLRGAQASFPQSEQMKHDTCNALALESLALNGRRYGAPRNRFFT
jgi:hypothetical protein